MATSSNATIQKLMDEINGMDPADVSIEDKLNLIAQKVAEEQQRAKAALGGLVNDKNLIDPADEFACEGCQ